VLLMERLAKGKSRDHPDRRHDSAEFAPGWPSASLRLTADCIGLDINAEGFWCRSPFLRGTCRRISPRPPTQMPRYGGHFQEIPRQQPDRQGGAGPLQGPPEDRVRLVRSSAAPAAGRIEDAKWFLCGGRGMGARRNSQLFELANSWAAKWARPGPWSIRLGRPRGLVARQASTSSPISFPSDQRRHPATAACNDASSSSREQEPNAR